MTSPDPSDPTNAVLLGALALLRESGRADIAAVLDDAELEPVGRLERWEVGSREVDARSFSLVVSPKSFVALRDPATLERVRDAIAAVVRSHVTELSSLSVVVRLPVVGLSWGHVYRSAAPPSDAQRPSEQAILSGAEALANALDDASAAEALATATLESAEVPTGGDRALRRYVLRLTAASLARAEKHRPLGERLRWLIEHAATRADEAVADVELRLRLVP
jgi:hypothetical protein